MTGKDERAEFEKWVTHVEEAVALAGEMREEDYETWRAKAKVEMLKVWGEMCRYVVVTNMKQAFIDGRSPETQACSIAIEALSKYCEERNIPTSAIEEACSLI